MKNLSILFIALLFLQITTSAQEGWFEQLSGTTSHLFSVHFTDNDTGWTVGFEGTILNTKDGGENWNPQTSGTTNHLLSVHFTDNNTGWIVGVRDTILKTTDGGENWNPQTSGTTSSLVSVHFTDNNTGWAVGESGTILNTTDGGTIWTSQASGITDILRSVHFADNINGWAVGYGGKILKTTNGGVTFVEDEEIDEVPTEYKLSNNFPDPFNPSTKLRYSVPQSSQIQIKIFDILGNEIETLVNEEKPIGTYEIVWYAENLPSGVYFYRLQAGDFVEIKKMILLR